VISGYSKGRPAAFLRRSPNRRTVQICTKICGKTTMMYEKLGTKTKKFKTFSYMKQKVQKFVESKKESFRSGLSEKFCTFCH
jgi:hypothetical protein